MKQEGAKQKAKVGQSIREWTADAGLGYSTYFTIPEELRPTSVKVGSKPIIIEPAADWLRRMAARGGVVGTDRYPAAA